MTPTRLACLTPAGAGAIATLALRGPAAWTLVCELAQRRLPPEPQSGRFWWCRLGAPSTRPNPALAAAAGEAGRWRGGEADDVVVAVRQATPEPWLEIHCHGGREVVRWLEELLTERGVEICTWQQLENATTNRPFRTATLDVLVNALTSRTASIALDQYHGAMARAAGVVRAALVHGNLPEAERMLADLERYADIGRHLTTPWRVVIAGAPNVGKSSLVNALAGYQRSVVAATPGTTRDVVTTLLALDGWPVEVADTAGWRSADEGLEQAGIARARAASATADLCLWVLDASVPAVLPDANLKAVRFVVNKVDLPAAWPLDEVTGPRVSAVTGAGLPELCQRIADWLVPAPPPPGAGVPVIPEVAAAVAEARRLLRQNALLEAQAKLEQLGRECN
jgi:tRNA modification GTPase